MTLKGLVHFSSTPKADLGRFNPIQPERARNMNFAQGIGESAKYLRRLEARGGIEPPNKGFADLCLTTWLPRRCYPEG